MTAINGTVDREFLAVTGAVAAIFAAQPELGAAVAVYVGGRQAVDLVAGVADKATGMVSTADARALIFSVSKGVS